MSGRPGAALLIPASSSRGGDALPTKDATGLTPRERQVLELIGQGLRGRAAAARLGMAYYTLRKHRLNILAKLGLTTAAQLSAAAAAMLAEAAEDPGAGFKPGGGGSPPGSATWLTSSSRAAAPRRSPGGSASAP